jgi:hypothetical protein
VAHITTHYGIVGPVPFLDVDIDVDNHMFVDPHAIRLQRDPEPFVSEANRATESFFDEVARCARSTSSAIAKRRGLDLLQHFEEPWETRLGLARRGFRGHGGAKDVGSWIWESLTTDLEAFLRVGVLHQIEDLPLFVEGIDRDITSDVTTRIVFDALAGFTADVVQKFPQFRTGGHQVAGFDRQVWDTARLAWTVKNVALPVADGKPLLLVPRHWARPTLLMSARRFYDTSVLTYAQLEQAVRSHEGELLLTPKDVLKQQSALARGRGTNMRVTRRASERDDNLVAIFKQFVDSRYEVLDDEIA